METLVSLLVGIGLGAAAGFRLLVPFLVMSMAAIFGHFPLSPDLQWLGTYPALEALGLAVAIETLMYYIPWLDHLLDIFALPAAMIAGTLITASFGSHLDPFLQWSLAIIAGGGTAGAIKGLTGFSRIGSTATTGGLGNFVVATIELVSAVILAVMAIVLPKLAVVLALLLILVLGGTAIWLWLKHKNTPQPSTESS